MSLRGTFTTDGDADVLGRALFDVLLDGGRVLVVDLSKTVELSPEASRKLVAAGEWFKVLQGEVVLSGVRHHDAVVLGALDVYGHLGVLRRPT